MTRKRPTSIFVLIAFGIMTLTGCATTEQKGAAVGGVGSAGLGAAIGAATREGSRGSEP